SGRGPRRDRRRRCARRGLPRRRPSACSRDRRALRRQARDNAVKIARDGAGRVIRVAEEISGAAAVVALETTLVAHGFPPGEGLEVGLEAERRVRAAGAVPATVGIVDGEVVVGLTEDELA